MHINLYIIKASGGRAQAGMRQKLRIICFHGCTSSLTFYILQYVVPGIMFDGRGEYQEALIGTFNAVLFEPNYVPSKILMASLILKMGFKASPVARSLLSDALRIEPTNRMAWYYLGLTHKADGRLVDAADCFQAASMLEESDPIENFSCML